MCRRRLPPCLPRAGLLCQVTSPRVTVVPFVRRSLSHASTSGCLAGWRVFSSRCPNYRHEQENPMSRKGTRSAGRGKSADQADARGAFLSCQGLSSLLVSVLHSLGTPLFPVLGSDCPAKTSLSLLTDHSSHLHRIPAAMTEFP